MFRTTSNVLNEEHHNDKSEEQHCRKFGELSKAEAEPKQNGISR